MRRSGREEGKRWLSISILFFVLCLSTVEAQEQEGMLSSRELVERLTRLEEGQKALSRRLEDGLAAVNQRIEAVDKRLDQGLAAVNQRIEAVDKRLDQGLAAVNQRIEVVDKRLDELREFLLWGFGLTFAGVFALIGFVLWDRRTALAPAVRRIEELQDREHRLEAALREYARGTSDLAEALRKYGLF